MTKSTDGGFPDGWDRLSEVEVEEASLHTPAYGAAVDDSAPRRLTVLSAAWADLVFAALLTTVLLAAVLASGASVSVAALPWAAAVAGSWWFLAALVCLRVRRGTPGMLVAGFVFSDEVWGRRVALVLVAALISALLLGLPLLAGKAQRSLLTAASGRRLVTAPA